MKNLLVKECRLAAATITYFFLAAGLLTLIPGYPILMGVFFTCLGIFYSFQTMRENRDIEYSMLLPVSKAEVVKGKFAFVMLLQGCSFLVMALVTVVRMTALKNVEAYLTNPLMSANPAFLGWALVLFGLFNLVFLRGFFRTGYYIGKPFVLFCVCAFVLTGVAEALPHVPGLEALNVPGPAYAGTQAAALAAGLAAYALMTWAAIRGSIRSFEKIDI